MKDSLVRGCRSGSVVKNFCEQSCCDVVNLVADSEDATHVASHGIIDRKGGATVT